jgi:hypothetical protein
MSRPTKEQLWREMSDKFVRRNRLPNGTKIVLRGQKRLVRDDLRIRRYLFVGPRLDDDLTVHQALHSLGELILTHWEELGKLEMIAPDGAALDGHTKIRTVRDLPALLTSAELTAAANHERAITKYAREFRSEIQALVKETNEPEEVVPRAVVRALAEAFDLATLNDALRAEKLR